MTNPWIYAAGAIIIGLLSGVVGAALVRRIILKGREDRPEINDASKATSTFIFLFFVAIGVIVAIGFTDPTNLEPLPADILRKSPRILAAGLILIAGRAIAYAFGGMANNAFGGSTARVRSQLSASGRFVIYAVAGVLALSQLGVDTTILTIIAAAALFGVAGAFALLVGLGGRTLGGELAAGRYLHRLVRVGDVVEIGDLAGTVVMLHPASVEIAESDGSTVHVPNTKLTGSEVRVRRT